MTEGQIKAKAKEQFPNDEFKQQVIINAINWATKELQEENADLKKRIKKARSIVHRLLVVIQEHKWWNYTVIDEARAFMSEVDRDKNNV